MRVLPEIASLSERQLGVVARWQMMTLVPEGVVDAALRSGGFHRMQHGVYRVAGGARTPEQAAVAATLRCGPGATLSGPIALRLYDIDGIRADDPFTVLLPPGRRVDGVTFPTLRDPDPDRAVATHGQLRVAGAIDALLDSAAFVGALGERRLRLAHDAMRWRGLLRPGRLHARASSLRMRPQPDSGLASLLSYDAAIPTGEGEHRLGELLSRFDPPPEPQVWVTPSRRVDWYFRSVRVGYEYQGSVDHGTVAGRLSDDARDAELRDAGIRLAYLTAEDLADERVVLGTVASALTVRAHELGVEPPRLRSP